MKPYEQRFININMPFIHEIYGLTITKLLDVKTGSTKSKIKVKFIRNTGSLDITNNSPETLIFSKNETVG